MNSNTETEQKRRVPTIEAEKEPEYVGAYSAIVDVQCQHYKGEYVEDVERCENNATHTIVMYDGNKLAKLASCEECGEPDELGHHREWTGVFVDE